MDNTVKMNVKYYNRTPSKSVDWLWYPYIPYGKITILQGDPGDGKSTFVLALLSLISKGDGIPTLGVSFKQSPVVYQNSEDGIADTIVPRLTASGADLSNVAYIDEMLSPFCMGDDGIEYAIQKTNARVLVLDPLQAYFGDVDMNRASQVRQVFAKLARVASEYNCAIILVGHMSKSFTQKGLYRGLGSIDIPAAARSVLMISKTPDDMRLLTPVKSNLAPLGKSIIFRIEPDFSIKWIKYSNISISQIMAEDFDGVTDSRNKVENAIEIIRYCLASNITSAKQITDCCIDNGISSRTIAKAKAELSIVSIKTKEGWIWQLGDKQE